MENFRNMFIWNFSLTSEEQIISSKAEKIYTFTFWVQVVDMSKKTKDRSKPNTSIVGELILLYYDAMMC